MTREQTSRQEKKSREYSERVTPGNRRNAEARKKEKKKVGRETRRKTDELFAQVKPLLSLEDAEMVASEVTATRLRKSVNFKQVLKYRAAPFSKVIEWQQERRRETIGRKKREHPHYNRLAKQAIDTLNSINENRFADVARRAGVLCSLENQHKYVNKKDLHDPIDHALDFLRKATSPWSSEHQALCRNEELSKSFQLWLNKANLILRKDAFARQKKADEQQVAKKKLKADHA